MAKAIAKVSESDLKRMESVFHALPDSLQRQVQRKILGYVGTELKKEYRKRTPESSKTGTAKGWSKSTAAPRAGNAHKLKKAVTHKPSSKWKNKRELARRGILGVTAGYDYTRGKLTAAPHAHLANDGHVAVYWGRQGGGRVAGINWQDDAQQAAAASSRAIVLSKARGAVITAAKQAAKKAGK